MKMRKDDHRKHGAEKNMYSLAQPLLLIYNIGCHTYL